MTAAHDETVLPEDLARFTRDLVAVKSTRDLVFIDTETITLAFEPGQLVVWEIYAERHNTAGTIEVAHLFPEHNEHLLNLPERFHTDYTTRVPPPEVRTHPHTVGAVLAQLLRRRGNQPPPTVVGANPHFDTTRIGPYLHAADATDGSHFRRLDVEAAAYGHLGVTPHDADGGLVGLTTRFGLPIVDAHTAHGDVTMTKNLYLTLFRTQVTDPDQHPVLAQAVAP